MQAVPNSSGVIQWVIPPQIRPKKVIGGGSLVGNIHDTPGCNFVNIHSVNSHSSTGNATTHLQLRSAKSEKPVLDMSVCRTICTFVDEHLRELRQHQQLINETRSRLVLVELNDGVDSTTFITRSDLSKLRVRDQQTRAIETIKQLTNYLRELAHLKASCDSSITSADEETLAKLSDIRSDIVQALNDFVLLNDDIDMPIIDLDEFSSQNGYDLCADAAGMSGEQAARHIDESIRSEVSLGASYVQIDANSSDEQYSTIRDQFLVVPNQRPMHYELRQREIQKIERDTAALRQLFAEFYNLIRVQDEQIDSIASNIVITPHRLHDGHLSVYKSSLRRMTILVSVTGCMAGALIGGPVGVAVGGKLGCIAIGFASSLLGLLSSYTAQRHLSCVKMARDGDE